MVLSRILAILLLPALLAGQALYRDAPHRSRIFAESRNYRIFLPPDYEISGKRYPVIYYFHGHSDRYTLEHHDSGLDTIPKIAAFVRLHHAIVVAPDGYVARDYSGFYGGSPYDVRKDGGEFDYGEYFLELVRHIDTTYRTITSRRYRATSGLSMGGFMSLYLSARYPESIGSASAFNPGPEFFVGEKGRRSLWRPKDHVLNHRGSMIRLIRASGDYISQYHEETREEYARTPGVDFEFRQDEYHRHWATSIGETFEFHMRAFANPALDTLPERWNYTSAQHRFEIRDMRVEADVTGPALILLEHVAQDGMRVRTRRWAPDGPPASCSNIHVVTAPLYRPAERYQIRDHSLADTKTAVREVSADSEGRLSVAVDCSGHEISFAGPGTGEMPLALPLVRGDVWRVRPGQELGLPLRIYNPRSVNEDITAELTSDYPTVEILRGKAEWKSVRAGESVDASTALAVRFTAGSGDWAHARLNLKLTCCGAASNSQDFDVLIAPDDLAAPAEVAILDGRSHSFPVFRQSGNRGGGSAVPRSVTEGRGNGNGVLQPGEEATIWVRLPQGLDPFDKNNWTRAKIYSDSPWITEIADIQEDKQREWSGAQSRTSVVRVSREVPAGTEIPLILDCESWSFTYTPDARFGKEPLYQAFQFHKHHLFAWTWKVSQSQLNPQRSSPNAREQF